MNTHINAPEMRSIAANLQTTPTDAECFVAIDTWVRDFSLRRGLPRDYVHDPVDRFMAKVLPEPNSGCWFWLGCVGAGGYGSYRIGSRSNGSRKIAKAHRVAFELFKGKIENGLHIDHLCRNRICVNPDHLRQVTKKENTLCGISFSAINKKKTHCPSGHSYSGSNVYFDLRGGRACKACHNKRGRGSRKRAMESRLLQNSPQMQNVSQP